jgi:hypothetical protein
MQAFHLNKQRTRTRSKHARLQACPGEKPRPLACNAVVASRWLQRHASKFGPQPLRPHLFVMRIKQKQALFSMYAVALPIFLSGCGGSSAEEKLIDFIRNGDEIRSVEVFPSPVPKAATNQYTEFKIQVRVNSKIAYRSLFLDAPVDNRDRYLGIAAVCNENNSCGDVTAEINCRSLVTAARPNIREISCGYPYLDAKFDQPVGKAELKVSVRQYSILSGIDGKEDDSRSFFVDFL